jgi:hypothetical protein
MLATGGIWNFGLKRMEGKGDLKGWQWTILIQGLITCVLGIIIYWWMVDFLEHPHWGFWFLGEE